MHNGYTGATHQYCGNIHSGSILYYQCFDTTVDVFVMLSSIGRILSQGNRKALLARAIQR